jgi:nitric oxide reductase subunit B
MNGSLVSRFMTKKSLYATFWIVSIFMVTILIYFTANLAKEVPPLPAQVKTVSGKVLYTEADIVEGKGYFQQFDLMDYGTMLGMGAYLGPDFSTEFLHKRAEFLNDYYAKEFYKKPWASLSVMEQGAIKARTIQDMKEQTTLKESGVVYTDGSALAYQSNVDYLVNFLTKGDKARAWRGGVIRAEEATKIAAFVDWSQLVASSLRPGTDRTWSNNWPPEPLIDQDVTTTSHFVSLWEFLLLWTLTIGVVYLAYEFLFKKEEEDGVLAEPLKITKLFPSQEKLLKYVPIVALFIFLQMVIGGYLAHIYADPIENFLISQDILPFNVMRALHTNLAIIWVAIGWLVGGLLIAPIVAGKDLRFPRLVDLLWVALLIVGGGGLIGIYMGATGNMRDTWFWLGNEGRELLNLGRVWDIGLVVGLVLWFGMVYSTIRNAKGNKLLIGTIIWSSFGIATLYLAGMYPIHKIAPNYTVDDYYRWWVVHLWVELTFELFAAGVIAFLSVALGLVREKTAEKVMLFELGLIMFSGTLGVGHHYWWQGLDEYWIAIGGIFSALEPLPLALLMIEAIKEQQHIKSEGKAFDFGIPFMWLAGSAFLNWFGAGFLGMVINTPTISYYSHGTYLIMPHAHVALLGAFGYISIAFIYMTARANSLAKGLEWNESLSKLGFWLLTIGVLVYAIPTIIIGTEQTAVAHKLGYYAARSRDVLESMKVWMWVRILPDAMMILGSAVILWDTVSKIYLAKKVR